MHPTGVGRLPGWGFYIGACAWFFGVMYLGWIELWQQPNGLPLSNLQLAIVLPMLAFGLAVALIPAFKRYIYSLDLLFLNGIQTWRVLGGAFLVVWGYGLLPGGFALPMAILDMSVGIIAVYVVYAMARQKAGWMRGTFWLNTWGFADFWVTITLVIVGRPLAIDPPAIGAYVATVAELPLSMFPSFAIPFFSCIHFAALMQWARLRKLKRMEQAVTVA